MSRPNDARPLTRQTPAAAAALRAARTALLCSHVSPDGDTIGSVLALRLMLAALGVKADAACEDPVPGNLSDLPGADAFRTPAELTGRRWELMVAVDCADPGRLGACASLADQADRLIQIDHHGTNPGYAAVNDVDGTASATGLLVLELLHTLDLPLTADIGACLYAAVSTDTGNFSFGNTTPEAFLAAAELREAGVPMPEWNRRLFRLRPAAQAKLIGRALSALHFAGGGHIAAMRLAQDDFTACGALPEHADTVVNFGMDIEGMDMAVLMRETPNGDVKFSLRAIEPFRVDAVARAFGGGGHGQAAGCTVRGVTPEAAEKMVLAALEQAYAAQKRGAE